MADLRQPLGRTGILRTNSVRDGTLLWCQGCLGRPGDLEGTDQLGVRVDIEATEHTIDGMLDAIENCERTNAENVVLNEVKYPAFEWSALGVECRCQIR